MSSSFRLGYDLVTFNQTLDFMNFKAFPIYGCWDIYPSNNPPSFYKPWESNLTNNIDFMVKFYISNGMAASKINLGIPFHGFDPYYNGQTSYLYICLGYYAYQDILIYDPLGQTSPYISYSDSWAVFDDPTIAIAKTQYALKMGLGGVMAWDVTQDDSMGFCGKMSILTAISNTLFTPSTPLQKHQFSALHQMFL